MASHSEKILDDAVEDVRFKLEIHREKRDLPVYEMVQQRSDLPVETISKLEAQEFVAKLNELHGGYRYRLPTEAEWPLKQYFVLLNYIPSPYESHTYLLDSVIKSRIPLTIADSAHPGCNRDDRTSNVYIP